MKFTLRNTTLNLRRIQIKHKASYLIMTLILLWHLNSLFEWVDMTNTLVNHLEEEYWRRIFDVRDSCYESWVVCDNMVRLRDPEIVEEEIGLEKVSNRVASISELELHICMLIIELNLDTLERNACRWELLFWHRIEYGDSRILERYYTPTNVALYY